MKDYTRFAEYYEQMVMSGDCDPAYPAMKYLCDRFDLNLEQRYWVAFLYATNYCVPTAFYIYNEFPDFENVDVPRMQRWWDANKGKLLFQSDRLRVKTGDQFVKIFESYRQLVGSGTQHQYFSEAHNYDELFGLSSNIYYFGRFSVFNHLEAIKELTGFGFEPTTLPLNEAESSRNGLCYVLGEYDFISMHHTPPKAEIDYDILYKGLSELKDRLTQQFPHIKVTYWNIETALCAFKKLFWGTRYLGYYIDRQQQEIETMQRNVTKGVEWQVLWDFRKEHFDNTNLGEFKGRVGFNLVKFQSFKILGKVHKIPKIKGPVVFDIGRCYQ